MNVFIILISLCSASPPFRFVNQLIAPAPDDTKEAFQFIEALLSPKVCVNATYAVVEMGCGGGFAAHFQHAASRWILAAAALNYSVPVIIQGKINGYSEGTECKSAKQQWTCFFQPLSTCEPEFERTGKKVEVSPKSQVFDDSLVPAIFSSRGLTFTWWWGAVQANPDQLLYQHRPP
jgi:hypothetical protein